MVDLSHLFSLADFSLSNFLFGESKSKKKINTEKEEKVKEDNIDKVKNDKKNKKTNKLTEKEKKLILNLEIEIDNYLYRKKVKSLIQKVKDNYIIICSANIPNLSLNIISSKKNKQYELSYEPILKQNMVFLPRKKYRNKKKLKFNFANSKNEIFIEPQYKTENENGSFINVIDLREIKEKEYKNFEDFENFMKQLKSKRKEINEEAKENIKIKEKEKKEDEKEKYQMNEINKSLFQKSQKMFDKNEFNEIKTNYITDNEFSNDKLKTKKLKKRKISASSLNKDYKNSLGINSILKPRNSQRDNLRKISFGNVQFSY